MIVLGRIVAPFGVRGWVKVHPFGDDPASWAHMPRWWFAQDDQAGDEVWQSRKLEECATHGKGLVARFEGVNTRAAAESLAGHYVGAPREFMPETAREEYYWADLVGLEVVNLADERLGRVADLLASGAHDVLRVRDEEIERLVPFVAAVVKDVDLERRRIRVDWGRDW